MTNTHTNTNSMARRQLLVMRHAKSSWSTPGMADYDRPLNARGQSAAPLMGQRLQADHIKVDIILASTACRVRETLKRLETEWDHGAQVIWEQELYLADTPVLMKHLSMLDDSWSRVMLIGHNPGLSLLVMSLTDLQTDLPTAAIAALEGPALDWSRALKGSWIQRDYWTPKD